MEQAINTITLRGSLQALPEFSHENHGKRFWRFTLEVPRLSGAIDFLPVVAEEPLISSIDPTAGSMLTVTGQIRSHNQRAQGSRRLLIFVFAASILPEDGEPINDVILEGHAGRSPGLSPGRLFTLHSLGAGCTSRLLLSHPGSDPHLWAAPKPGIYKAHRRRRH